MTHQDQAETVVGNMKSESDAMGVTGHQYTQYLSKRRN
jgi:hypothetical protein